MCSIMWFALEIGQNKKIIVKNEKPARKYLTKWRKYGLYKCKTMQKFNINLDNYRAKLHMYDGTTDIN